nr:hypothetical protein [Tanacetum cinerariifolium]
MTTTAAAQQVALDNALFWLTINKKDSTSYRFKTDKKRNVDFVKLLWKDFTFQIDNIDYKKQEKMYYTRFTKAIIHHFITKNKSISMWNRMFMHTAEDDSILGPIRFISKAYDYQVYGALLHEVMTNQKMRDSPTYKNYLAFATGAGSPKKARKFKKPVSPSRKRTLVIVKGEKHDLLRKLYLLRSLIENNLLMYKSETLLVCLCQKRRHQQQLIKAYELICYLKLPYLRRLKVPDEPKGKFIDINEGTGLKQRVLDVSKADSSKNAMPADSEKGNKKMTNAETVNFKHEEVPRTSSLLTNPVSVIPEHTVINPSEIVTTASATTISSFISSLFPTLQQSTLILTPTTKAKTSTIAVPESETLFVLHQRITNLEKDVKELKNVDHSSALLSTIKSEVQNVVKEYLGISLDYALYNVLQKHSTDIIKEHSVLAKFIENLRQQYVPMKSIDDIQKIKIKHTSKQQVPKSTITSSDTAAFDEFDQKTTLFNTMTKSKSFNKSPKHRALYHALIELILKDEDAMDKCVMETRRGGG